MVTSAQQQAREAANDPIGIGHLVLGLVAAPDSAAARAIVAQQVSPQDVERMAKATLPPAAASLPALIPFDDNARNALERSFAQAQDLGSDTVGSEHLLLAVLAVDHGTGVLAGLGVTPEPIEGHLHGGTRRGRPDTPCATAGSAPRAPATVRAPLAGRAHRRAAESARPWSQVTRR